MEQFSFGLYKLQLIKRKKNVVLTDYVWPDKDNTFLNLDYHATGSVTVSAVIPNKERVKTKGLVELVNLDKRTPRPGTIDYASASDRRYENRLSAYITSQEVLADYENAPEIVKPYIVKNIMTMVEGAGYWSVWMTVFEHHPNIRLRLIAALPGTSSLCFDGNGNPIPR